MSNQTPILTAARQSVWDAINNDAYLANLWKATFRYEDTGAGREAIEPSLGQCPAIAIWPGSIATAWTTNQSHKVAYPLVITFWTKQWNVLEGERIFEAIVRAVYRNCPPNSGRTYVREGTGHDPEAITALTATQVILDEGPEATRWEFGVQLYINWNPLTKG